MLQLLAFLVIAFTTNSAVSQGLEGGSENIFRASYCTGVLEEMYRAHSSDLDPLRHAFSETFCDGWQGERFETREACAEQKSQQALSGTKVKLQRYADFVNLRLPKLRPADAARASAQQAKGRLDQITSWSRIDTRDAKCGATCRGGGLNSRATGPLECVADCIERYDPVQAAIYRCVVVPNSLPF
jgi:hypothetical protein